MDLKKYGPWALIVSGCEGVGAVFARKLAAAGFKLIRVARKPATLSIGSLDLATLRKRDRSHRAARVDGLSAA
jgi:short-subunit dehydrogenase